MAAKKEIYIEAELDWCEEQLASWRRYIDANPIENLVDRMDYKETKNGGMMRTTVATIEQQIKSLRDTLKEYLALLAQVKILRAEEEKKKLIARGGHDVPVRMQNR